VLYVTRLEFENYGPFAGKHSIELNPGVYAVVAATEDDAERSNWIGKSTFLSAFPFVLHGWHLHRTEDEFITGGHGLPLAPYGGVTATLSDGTVVKRMRKRGASTQLTVKFPLREEQGGAGAQAALLKHIGFNESDYFEAAFFKQKDMARFINPTLMQPSERQELVRKWFDLEPLERCEEKCWARANVAQAELDALDKPAADVEAFWDRVAANMNMPAPRIMLPQAIAETRAHIETLSETIQGRAGQAVARAAAARFASIDAEGKALRAQHDAIPYDAPAHAAAIALRDKLHGELGPIKHEHQQAAAAQFGKFDGKCPVAGIACPATERINTMGEELVSHCSLLRGQRDTKEAELNEAATGLRMHEDALRRRDQLTAKLDALRPQAKEALAASKGATSATPEEEALDAALEPALRNLQTRLSDLESLEREGARLQALVPDEAKRRAVETRVMAARAGARIYKQVTRSVAKGSLDGIASDTNRLLTSVGIDLSVFMAWNREGKDLATSCDECGAPYPKSAKVKECARCGAKRGPKLVERLDIGLSNVSGAAEDLAGIALRLALGAWLRKRRGAQWSTTCIDEPFGSLDVAHRKVLTRHLATLLGAQHGFVQAFVVAHDRAICDSLPHRVELVGTREGTRFA
jgi:DNA repair exonuclease SbcCD ATPase subunit